MSEQTLSSVPLSEPRTVARVDGTDPLSRRLEALGFREGAEVVVLRRAPLGDPLLIALPWSRIALRRDEAERILVRPRAVPEVAP